MSDHFPKQLPPVRRGEVVQPHRCVDVHNGTPEQLVAIRLQLTHGANYNDPAHFQTLGYQERLRTH